MDDVAFEQALEEYNQAYQDAEPFNNWYPDDNTYVVSVSKVNNGISDKPEGKLVWWKVMVRIHDQADETLDGKEFSLGFFSNKSFGSMKTTINMLTEDTSKRDLKTINEQLKASVGKLLTVRVSRKENKTTGKTFTNVDIVNIIKETAATDEPAAA
jgi:hypothetical protein